MTHPVTFTGHVLQHAMQRAGLDPAEVEDVIVGGTFFEGAAGMNVARQVALRAGCPVTTSGLTVNRFCSTGLQTIALAAQRVISGEGEVYAAGGNVMEHLRLRGPRRAEHADRGQRAGEQHEAEDCRRDPAGVERRAECERERHRRDEKYQHGDEPERAEIFADRDACIADTAGEQ